MEKKINNSFLLLIRILWTYKWSIIIINGVVLLITVIALLVKPNEYKSTMLISIEGDGGGMQLPSILKDLPLGLSAGIGGDDGMTIEKIIRYAHSRRVFDTLIDEFNLMEYYDSKYRENVYKTLFKEIDVVDNEDGTFYISFVHKNGEIAVKIVDRIYDILKMLDIEIASKKSKQYKDFIAARYVDAMNTLEVYENELKRYSEKSGLLLVEEQIKAEIEILAELERNKINAELERDILLGNMNNSNNGVKNANRQIEIIQNKINDYYKKSKYSNIPIDSIPSVSLKYARLFRNVKIQEAVLEFIVPQLEKAKIDEKKDYTSLIIIDKPIVAEKKYRPKRLQILLIVTILSLFVTLILIKLHYFYRENKNIIKEIVNNK